MVSLSLLVVHDTRKLDLMTDILLTEEEKDHGLRQHRERNVSSFVVDRADLRRLTSKNEFAEHIRLIEDGAIPALIAKLILTFFDGDTQ